MRICLINGQLGPALESLGHEVLTIHARPGLHDVNALLAPSGFRPDLLFQTELLGSRALLSGLETLACRKVFWSVDTHLNAFWHAHYGRLFDAVATTQHGWVAKLRGMGLGRVFPLPWYGFSAPWTPFATRSQGVAFCGRIGPERPVRQRFADFIHQRLDARVEQSLTPREMLDLFADTRLLPNEAIAGEINFRLFEGASCGCLVLTQRGPDVEKLFEPGREVEVYTDALELNDRATRWLADPVGMERMGAAARERVQREHLPAHRAAALLEAVADLPALAASGREASLALLLTVTDLLETGRFDAQPNALETLLTPMLDMPEATVGLMRLLYHDGQVGKLAALIEGVLADGVFKGDTAVEASGSLAALALDRWDTAKLFWYRHHQALGLTPEMPADAYDLRRRWCALLARQGKTVRMGFVCDPERNLPQCAFEALLPSLTGDTRHMADVRAAEALLSEFPGTEETRLALLSELSLRDRNNWRLGLRLGLVNLRAFRLEQGLEELHAAYEVAHARGAGARFIAALEREDPCGGLRAAVLSGVARPSGSLRG